MLNRLLAHVEQFKKELTREVLVMTQDVGRLHKERQAIEQQIADLFAFYSKQKQSSLVRPQFFFLPLLVWSLNSHSFVATDRTKTRSITALSSTPAECYANPASQWA